MKRYIVIIFMKRYIVIAKEHEDDGVREDYLCFGALNSFNVLMNFSMGLMLLKDRPIGR